ncbi:TrfB-related DNA-binding protein [Klebsiella pneumoniae]
MAQKNRITEAEWKQLLPKMASLAHITTDIGYSVLVKGEKATDVAARVGRSKQNISSTAKRIWDLYQSTTLHTEDGEALQLVQVWIPEKLAKQVLAEAAKYSVNSSSVPD